MRGDVEYGRVARIVAAWIALIALAGIVLYAMAQMGKGSTLPETLWVLVRFFTILCNVLVLVVFTAARPPYRGDFIAELAFRSAQRLLAPGAGQRK